MHFLISKEKIYFGFHVSLILKGFFDAGEIISGMIMLFMTPERMSKLIAIISKEELHENPGDLVMNYLVSYSQNMFIRYTAVYQHLSTDTWHSQNHIPAPVVE